AADDPQALARLRRVRFLLRTRLGGPARAARAPPRGDRGPAVRPAREPAARPRADHDAGRGDRRAAVRRHPRFRVPAPLRASGRAPRAGATRGLRRRRRRRARVVHRRRPGRCDPAVRRPAQAARPLRRHLGARRKHGERSMSFLWPHLLWLLLAVPLLVSVYLWALSRRKKVAVRYAGLDLVREAAGRQSWRRHVPPLLFLLAITTLLLAVARPSAVVTLPSKHETVVLTMDVSGSMRASDVSPTRLGAAQLAARSFIEQQPRSTRVGIVTFGGGAALVQPPTQSREDLMAAIDRFELQRGTAVGSGILMSLKTIFPDQEFELPS